MRSGVVTYVDPVTARLAARVGDIWSDGEVFVFNVEAGSAVKVNDGVTFSVDEKSGMAVLGVA